MLESTGRPPTLSSSFLVRYSFLGRKYLEFSLASMNTCSLLHTGSRSYSRTLVLSYLIICLYLPPYRVSWRICCVQNTLGDKLIKVTSPGSGLIAKHLRYIEYRQSEYDRERVFFFPAVYTAVIDAYCVMTSGITEKSSTSRETSRASTSGKTVGSAKSHRVSASWLSF